jgi:hypothetical protein
MICCCKVGCQQLWCWGVCSLAGTVYRPMTKANAAANVRKANDSVYNGGSNATITLIRANLTKVPTDPAEA